jgi:uncharacterized protein (UPF0261 family)
MAMKKILVLGTLDTKGEQLDYLRERIKGRGHQVILMDVSMGAGSSVEADVTPGEIVQLVGKNIDELRSLKDRFVISEAMTSGAQQMALKLYSEGKVDGIVTLGGATMALMGARAMQMLPFGIPKVIAVPAAMPVYVDQWFEATDIVIMQVIMELAGMNDLVRHAIEQTAGAISGMVEESRSIAALRLSYPSVAITELGFSVKCARQVEKLLEEKGYNVCSFHAQGISDRAMDRLISEGFFDGVIDIVPAGLLEEVIKGNRAAGMERLDATAERGIPQVLTPCCLNLTGCGPTRKEGEKYNSRPKIWKMDAMRSMTRLNGEELQMCAKLYAEKLNKTKGPVKFFIPLKGWSAIDGEGTILYDPGEDGIFIDELRKHLKSEVELVEVDCNLEDFEFAQALVESFDEMFRAAKK